MDLISNLICTEFLSERKTAAKTSRVTFAWKQILSNCFNFQHRHSVCMNRCRCRKTHNFPHVVFMCPHSGIAHTHTRRNKHFIIYLNVNFKVGFAPTFCRNKLIFIFFHSLVRYIRFRNVCKIFMPKCLITMNFGGMRLKIQT